MTLWLVLEDYGSAGETRLAAGSLVDDATLDLAAAQASGLAAIVYDPSTMGAARAAFLAQRGSTPRVFRPDGDLLALLSASGATGLGGITRLVDDVEAGPGTGTQSATVKRLDGRPLDSAAPAVDDLLVWDGAKWTYTALGDLADVGATRIIHTPGVTPTSATFVPGLAPDVELLGTLVVLHYKKDADKVYGYAKIPTSYVSDASFHVHWTKAVDTNQAGRTVRWVVRYTVFDGTSQNVTGAPTGTLTLDDAYDDAGLLTRIVYRTANAAAAGFVPGWYVSFEVGFDPAHTTLDGRPAIVSCDILSRQTINLGN